MDKKADNQLTHIDSDGNAHMVDISDKDITLREAKAIGFVQMHRDTIDTIIENKFKKGNVLAIAQLAGIMATKRTSDIIPLCHPLSLTSVDVFLYIDHARGGVSVESTCKTEGKTGVEMEALTAVSASCLTIYDMCKAIDRSMTIESITLVHKSGGRSGSYQRVIK